MKINNFLENRYSKSPALRSLIQLVPFGIGSAIDTAVITMIDNIYTERMRIFFDELQKKESQITQEMIESVDFIHCYMITLRASISTRRTEKIKIFARLLTNTFLDTELIDFDEYEENLTIIDDLSYREIIVLSMLESYENKFTLSDGENELQRANKFWDQFTQDLIQKFNISLAEVRSILTRLTRTGCYEPITGAYFDYDGGMGNLTPLYYKIKKMVLE